MWYCWQDNRLNFLLAIGRHVDVRSSRLHPSFFFRASHRVAWRRRREERERCRDRCSGATASTPQHQQHAGDPAHDVIVVLLERPLFPRHKAENKTLSTTTRIVPFLFHSLSTQQLAVFRACSSLPEAVLQIHPRVSPLLPTGCAKPIVAG